MRNVKDAEANDMIHMGSDHRCVMVTFLINMPEKKTNVRRGNKKHETTVYVEHEEKAKNTNIETSELEKRYQDIIVTIKKKPPPKKKTKHMNDTRNDAKDKMEKNAAAAAEAESTLVDTVAHETESGSKKRSSEADNLRGGFAHLEHRRPDGWTSTPRGKDDEKNCSEQDETSSQPFVRTGGEEDAHDTITYTGCDLRAGERLPKQRPLGDEHPERIPEEHLGAQMIHQVGEAGSIVLQISRSLSVFKLES